MITLLVGKLVMKEADRVVVMTASGVGYECFVPTRSLESMPSPGQPVELHTHLSVREDALTLFGFGSSEERRVFQRLITVNGIGPRLGLALLSQLTAERIVKAIRERDIGTLSSVSGVGKKTAERIVLDLKDKTEDLGLVVSAPQERGASSATTKALMALGYSAAEADEAVRGALAANGAQEPEELLKAALSQLGGP